MHGGQGYILVSTSKSWYDVRERFDTNNSISADLSISPDVKAVYVYRFLRSHKFWCWRSVTQQSKISELTRIVCSPLGRKIL